MPRGVLFYYYYYYYYYYYAYEIRIFAWKCREEYSFWRVCASAVLATNSQKSVTKYISYMKSLYRGLFRIWGAFSKVRALVYLLSKITMQKTFEKKCLFFFYYYYFRQTLVCLIIIIKTSKGLLRKGCLGLSSSSTMRCVLSCEYRKTNLVISSCPNCASPPKK